MTAAPVERDELVAEFDRYVDVACRSTITGDFDPWADLFEPEAVYVERVLGTFSGREAIRHWMTNDLKGFPQSEMVDFPITWSVVDERQRAVVFACFNQLSDPGDHSRHRALVWARLLYGGDGLWTGEENIYNLNDFVAMAQGWLHARDADQPAPTWVPISERPAPDVPVRPSTAEELTEAFARYYEVIAQCRQDRNWERFGELFTPDAVYVDHAVGVVQGRSAIVDWMVETMRFEDYQELDRFEVLWQIVDPERGWVVSATKNVMRDLGQGVEYAAHDWGRMTYAGDGRWSYKENMYNPDEFVKMFSEWKAARDGS